MSDERPDSDDTLVATGASPAAGSELARGTVVGRYVVLSVLGRGGMGVVYAAYDPELDRKVALKLLHTQLVQGSQTNDGHRRLAREAQAMAQLAHPNVITVHDVGEHDGRVFVAMEFVEGETLTTWLSNDHPWSEVLAVFLRAGHGLGAAHDKGLVHRDFKPQNVLVDRDGRVKVLDFGLARQAARSPDSERGRDERPPTSEDTEVRPTTNALGSELTRQGSVVGTPAYMAPEQHLGLELDAKSDQFAFCVALWEGLYGERPFAGDTLAALAFAVTQGKRRDAPTGTRVPRWVLPVLGRGLSTDPEDRFGTLAELLEALGRGAARRRRRATIGLGFGAIVVGLATLAGWRLDKARKRTACQVEADAIMVVWSAETRTRLRTALVGTGVFYAESAFALAVPHLDSYVEAWRGQYRDLCVATRAEGTRSESLWRASRHCLDGRRGELAELLTVLAEDPDATAAEHLGEAVAGLARLEPCADDAWLSHDQAHPASPEEGELRRGLWRALALQASGRSADGLALARELVELAAGHQSVRLRADALRVAGSLAEKTGAYQEAEAMLVESFDLALSGGEDDLARTAASELVMTVGVRLARYDEALLWARVARGLRARAGPGASFRDGSLYSNLGVVLEAQGRLEEAERAHDTALSVFEHALGVDHPNVATSYDSLGTVYEAQGRYAEAERAHAKAIAILGRALGPDHPRVAPTHVNLATVYKSQGRYDEAERVHGKAIAILERAFGPDHPHVGASLNNLGLVYGAQGRYEEAEQVYEKARAILLRELGADHPHVALLLSNLGLAYGSQGLHAKAERAHADALATFEKALPSDHPHVASGHHNLGLAILAQGRYAEAERALIESLAISEPTLGGDHPDVASTVDSLGLAYRGQSRFVEAESVHARALALRERALGPDHPQVARSLAGLAAARLGLGRADQAMNDAERAVAIRVEHDVKPRELAQARFLLARALWAANVDRGRARVLAEQARDTYRDAGAARSDALAEVDAWLERRR